MVFESANSSDLSGNCDIDVNECDSSPCQNGAACSDSTADGDISFHTYRCTCVEGFANGLCGYDDFIIEYTTECSVFESANSTLAYLTGNCDIDVNECDSSPCHNGATCTDSLSDVSEAHPQLPPHVFQCTCVAGYANGWCDYDYIIQYEPECQVAHSALQVFDGICDVDVNECDSNPCQNGATCVESTSDSSISLHAYQCICVAGFTNGWCLYDFIAEYNTECTVYESENSTSWSGNCDVDVDECASSPCANGGTCTESTERAVISLHAYRCTCVAGFANGVCEYDFIVEYTTECTVSESETASNATGNCDIDVDECDSSPCQNGATCSHSAGDRSLAHHAYHCECPPGWGGHECHMDFAECQSNPCANGGTCVDSTADPRVAYGSYSCLCAAGFANGICTYNFVDAYDSECGVLEGGNCDVDVNECRSNPCQNGATCHDSSDASVVFVHFDAYTCSCQRGFTGGLCDYNVISEFASECQVREGGNCGIDVDECQSSPCSNQATCTDSRDDGKP